MSAASRRAFYSLMASGAQPFIILGSFPDAVVGAAYDHTIDLTGSYLQPVAIDAVEGITAIPPGLVLEIDTTGTKARLHGTPLRDIAITGALPRATTGVPYSVRLSVLNAVGAVTIDIPAGDLPAWMNITWHSDTQEIEFHGMPT